MRCPFLREAQVRYCRISASPKVIGRAAEGEFEEKCSSPAYASCAVYLQRSRGSSKALCPYLEVSPAQYCSAVAERRPIPQRPLPSSCESGRYRYCSLFRKNNRIGATEPVIEGIRLPSGLWYAANHLWLDLAEDGWCHAGIDGLLAKLLGRVEQVTALVSGGNMRPAAVLRAHRLDWHVAFPNPIPEPAGNPQLRAHPDRLTADPYGDGWLFAGRVNPPDTSVAAGLIAGEQAVAWMRSEVGRISRRVRGRAFEHGLLDRLDRDEALSIFQDFCQ